MLAPHQERVVQEKSELDEKLGKLKAFFDNPIYTGLPLEEQNRLARQAKAMLDYSEILGERIRNF